MKDVGTQLPSKVMSTLELIVEKDASPLQVQLFLVTFNLNLEFYVKPQNNGQFDKAALSYSVIWYCIFLGW